MLRPDSGRYRIAAIVIAAPIGTLRKNPARHETRSATAPDRPVAEKPMAASMLGRAVKMIELSSTIMK